MCGFLAVFHGGPRPLAPSTILAGLSAIRHRGPDERDIWLDPEAGVALGHTRLSIIGLSNGRQPIASQDGALQLIVNGEFYDFERIRAELQARGCVFRTQSDSEIALHLYREFGTAGLGRLRGEFALVLYDAVERQLVVMRDRFGIKPLFVAEHDGALWVGSEIKALVAAGVPAFWDLDAYVSRGFYLGNRTLFQGIRSLAPGHLLIASPGHIRERAYWDLDFPAAAALDSAAIDEAEAVEGLRAEILEAVGLRLRADVPIAVYLSGGIDSSAMLGCATRLRGTPLDAFTLSFTDDGDYDERRFAAEAASFNGARFHPIPVTQDDLADDFEEALWHNEVPFFNAHGVAKYRLSRVVAQARFKVVITGEGADEIFAGYPHFRRDMLLYNAERQDPGLVADLRARLARSEGGYGGTTLPADAAWMTDRLGHGVSWVGNQSAWFDALRALYDGPTRRRSAGIGAYRRFYNGLDHARMAGRDPLHRSMYLWAKSFLPNFVLTTLGDRMEMANSIEGRVPLLDHHVAEYAARLPVWLKIRGATEKHVFREAMRPFLPEALYRRKKHYFRAPPAMSAQRNRLAQLVADTLASRHLEDLPFFDARAVRKAHAEAAALPPERQALLDPMFTEITSLCLMQRRFGLATHPATLSPEASVREAAA
ncbi:asparagine synthase (glutamine-hydrolyzing) [Methylobacterium nodulans]|uniref:asparagine synthase (glutamine-hydrolyzing) n=1 Tax=Methylobacterium nodulans (strain LMG 21967 / CNCM I-2342 / ORS 2060) TaxID=460265 RepID=B8IXH9_METNO|nr:asparagine synthase (glutamine-hydrolyzing) [Methylobacterium nodulans]ACL62811.1 asparagine synthase (glutamine-hydrolyzing) [Methylobacterium nodulans ORS 2060]